MNSTQSLHLNVPLGKDAHHQAQQFAAEQATPQKGKQVYLNTLAVYAVHSYLKWLSVETDLTQGDSWHPGLRAIFDVADLVLPNLGRLECRPVLPGETAFIVPPEVTENRLGYVAVQFNQQLDTVQLLGFSPVEAIAQPPEEIQIAELQSLDALSDTIAPSTTVKLRQWLEGIFNDSWQSPSLVLASNLRSKTRLKLDTQTNSVSRAKVIQLGRQGVPQAVVLVMQLTPTATEAVEVCLRLYPGSDSIHLPPNLQLIVLDETRTACMEAQARSADDWIQLEFSCIHEERFSVKVVLEEMSITEQFVV
ncbi:MAG TPA: hypothetical protein DCP31_41605 [Cyanobacteria bacterium UBA8543]|nr:hypothetical protein [Cyanobacteria bacterium UBA8543]